MASLLHASHVSKFAGLHSSIPATQTVQHSTARHGTAFTISTEVSPQFVFTPQNSTVPFTAVDGHVEFRILNDDCHMTSKLKISGALSSVPLEYDRATCGRH